MKWRKGVSLAGFYSVIEVTLKKADDTFQFSVKDYGTGIPVEMQAKVFEPYYQITNPKTNTQGMGLGNEEVIQKYIREQGGNIKGYKNFHKNQLSLF